MATKTKAKPQAKAAPAPKANGKAAKTQAKAAPEAEKRENRYLRASRIIIDAGEGLDIAELAVKAEMSESTAGHCREAFVGVTQALREAKLLPERKPAGKAPAEPTAVDKPAKAAEE